MLHRSKARFESPAEASAALPEWLRHEGVVIQEPVFIHNTERIGALIRERREKAGMSLRSAAKWMSISPTHLSDMELGKRPWLPARLADMTNVLDMAERTQQ